MKEKQKRNLLILKLIKKAEKNQPNYKVYVKTSHQNQQNYEVPKRKPTGIPAAITSLGLLGGRFIRKD